MLSDVKPVLYYYVTKHRDGAIGYLKKSKCESRLFIQIANPESN